LSSKSDRGQTPDLQLRDARTAALDRLVADIRACRICVDAPRRQALPHAPRPVLRPSTTARICVAGQAPGTRVHRSGMPFTDPSGVRLREWMAVTEVEFYDDRLITIVPMGFCFPGHDAHGGDRPPRPECAGAWRSRLFEAMPQIELVLAIGSHAQAWHIGPETRRAGMSETVRRWREILARPGLPRCLPLPHPSWRNNAWLKANPWFENEVLPVLRAEIRVLLSPPAS
jgi:uracil-DNA glycosylase